MKFILDAHLPRSLCAILAARGHDAIHTSDLLRGNRTDDEIISQISFNEQRVVISKDSDFFYSHTLHGRPSRLVLVRTGNIFGGKPLSPFRSPPCGHRERDANQHVG